MKTTKLLGIISCSLLSMSAFSQNWQLGGNASPPLNGTNNILGTNSNFPLRIATNGIQRMVINGNTGLTNGFVGINTNNPQYQLHVNGSGVANVVYIST